MSPSRTQLSWRGEGSDRPTSSYSSRSDGSFISFHSKYAHRYTRTDSSDSSDSSNCSNSTTSWGSHTRSNSTSSVSSQGSSTSTRTSTSATTNTERWISSTVQRMKHTSTTRTADYASAAFQKPTAKNIVGQIKFLPQADLIATDSIIHRQLVNAAGVYEHPVVITSYDAATDIVSFHLCTTLGSTSVEDKYPTNVLARRKYLRIGNDRTFGHDDTPVMFVKNALPRKRTYIQTEVTYTIEAKNLRELVQGCKARDICLTVESMEELKRYKAVLYRAKNVKGWR
jgi:hypothetical protein